VQVVEMALDVRAPSSTTALGVFLPLIAVNCAILGASLFMVERDYNLAESAVFGLGSGIGWALAIVALARSARRCATATSRRRCAASASPSSSPGLMAIGFMAFSGIQL
jgi:Na+-transporting NADH:ubiquinone oxidoreductase subunit E